MTYHEAIAQLNRRHPFTMWIKINGTEHRELGAHIERTFKELGIRETDTFNIREITEDDPNRRSVFNRFEVVVVRVPLVQKKVEVDG